MKIKRIVTAITALILMIVSATSCNMQLIDTTYTFDKAIIKMPNGNILEIDIKSWNDYEGDQLQIESTDGKVYLVHSSQCVMIKED